jgi:heme oxygenase
MFPTILYNSYPFLTNGEKRMGTTPPHPLFDQLRSHTWHRHEAFEKLPFVAALVDGTLPLESYIGQLRGLAVIFSALEQTLAQSRSPLITRIRPLMKSRFKLLCTDLAFFAPRLVPDILPAVQNALDIARVIRALSYTSSDKLLGYLYVLEGTTKGNQVHLPDIIKCFHLLDGEGVSFYRGYGDITTAHWEEFRSIANCAEEISINEALQGTVEIYDTLERFHHSLCPLSAEDTGFTASALNPEAGDHPVPQNREILHAAVRAGRRCRDEFSYYERRYGERGHRFTDSDAAWLAALADKPPFVVSNQVLWLGRVLSARGMPFLLMERQLEILVEELRILDTVVPTEALQTVAADLRQQRNHVCPQNRFDDACTTIARLIASHDVSDFPDLPLMLVGAHVDMLAGMPECMASLVSWLKRAAVLTHEELESVTHFFDDDRLGNG